jgi:hypothetical protein
MALPLTRIQESEMNKVRMLQIGDILIKFNQNVNHLKKEIQIVFTQFLPGRFHLLVPVAAVPAGNDQGASRSFRSNLPLLGTTSAYNFNYNL